MAPLQSMPISLHFNRTRDTRCPRSAFLQDLSHELKKFLALGDHIVLLIDGNSNMKGSDLSSALASLSLQETIIQRHGKLGPSTHKWNTKDQPIDGIWTSLGLDIKARGYFDFDTLVPNTDHRCLWIDSSFIDAFGRNMAPLQRPKARWLHNKDPRLVQNFVRVYKGLVSKQKLLQWAQSLESKVTYPMSSALSRDYEELDKLHTEAVKVAEKKCRSSKWDRGFFPRNWTRLSLHLSMVPYSPQSIWPQS